MSSRAWFYFPAPLQSIIQSTCVRHPENTINGLTLSCTWICFWICPWNLETEMRTTCVLWPCGAPEVISKHTSKSQADALINDHTSCSPYADHQLHLHDFPSVHCTVTPGKDLEGKICWCIYLASFGDLLSFHWVTCRHFSELTHLYHVYRIYMCHNIWQNGFWYTQVAIKRIPEQSPTFMFRYMNNRCAQESLGFSSGHQQEITSRDHVTSGAIAQCTSWHPRGTHCLVLFDFCFSTCVFIGNLEIIHFEARDLENLPLDHMLCWGLLGFGLPACLAQASPMCSPVNVEHGGCPWWVPSGFHLDKWVPSGWDINSIQCGL